MREEVFGGGTTGSGPGDEADLPGDVPDTGKKTSASWNRAVVSWGG